ncbi:MAG: exodeoxyribonuclease VII small subunit [Clostridia bacterium]|nr:exodeoxyribonuclease VII small subunit [Clostridia bacterium]MBR2054739.1 exodeoxyribonuclease VII small subunit [Clostridia bacterium]MBR6752632.1 exodeoxyribonuclease VII small subunit [Clostridia bacterium]
MVQKMENGNLPLEDTLKCYEEGIRLSRELNASLSDAEKRMLELSGSELLPMEDAP